MNIAALGWPLSLLNAHNQFMDWTVLIIVVVACVLIGLIAASVRIVKEYERIVVFRLGKLRGQRGPGLVLIIPAIDRTVRVDLRIVAHAVPDQDLITRDNVPARVAAVAYFRVANPIWAVTRVQHYFDATSEIAQTTLRSVLGKAELDQLLSGREELNELLRKIIDEQAEPWGVNVSVVEIKHVEIPPTMQRAMARQAEAERERRAKVINAEGEAQASFKLAEAASVLAREPTAIQLRYLQTLLEVGSENHTTVFFPIPLELLSPWTKTGNKKEGQENKNENDQNENLEMLKLVAHPDGNQ
jgi:regulator of protease activity HflC (stomatin/prohibitin superfamily)